MSQWGATDFFVYMCLVVKVACNAIVLVARVWIRNMYVPQTWGYSWYFYHMPSSAMF